jgi:hypothetical protein
MRMLLAALLIALLSPVACLADTAKDVVPAEVIAANKALVAQEPKATGVFTVQDDGAIKHVQSGLLCPARYPNVSFSRAMVFADDGTDVGCDYIRHDDKGGASAKLSIFAVKATADTALDAVFAKYRAEVVGTWEGAVSQGESIHVEGKSDSTPFPDIRSEEFLIPLNGRTYTTAVIVTISKGWVIEIRATFDGLPNVIDVSKGGTESAVLAGGDRVMGPKALFDALSTVGQ